MRSVRKIVHQRVKFEKYPVVIHPPLSHQRSVVAQVNQELAISNLVSTYETSSLIQTISIETRREPSSRRKKSGPHPQTV
jgi:hypothetical protein